MQKPPKGISKDSNGNFFFDTESKKPDVREAAKELQIRHQQSPEHVDLNPYFGMNFGSKKPGEM